MFYIHITDPGYPDPPYPGERRFGPYITKEEALNQAASDASVGMGTSNYKVQRRSRSSPPRVEVSATTNRSARPY